MDFQLSGILPSTLNDTLSVRNKKKATMIMSKADPLAKEEALASTCAARPLMVIIFEWLEYFAHHKNIQNTLSLILLWGCMLLLG